MVVQLQVATAGRVYSDGFIASIHPQPLDMGKGATLSFLDILQKAAGAGYGSVSIVATKSFEIVGLELSLQ